MTAYTSSRYQYEGIETTETTVVRQEGATDPTGQAQSRRIATTAKAQFLRPFRAEPYAVWNPTAGADVTVTVYGIAQGALPKNDEVWLEVAYPKQITPAATTLDGAATNVTLSNGNMTATHSNTTTNSGVRSLALLTSGKWYFEVVLTQGTGFSDAIGLITPAGTYTNLVTDGTQCCAYYRGGAGNIWSNGAAAGFALGGAVNGYTVRVAADLDNEKVWFELFEGWNSAASNLNLSADPATNTGGASISNYAGTTLSPALGFAAVSGGAMTANFGATPFLGYVPPGFAAWGAATTLDGTATNVVMSNGNLTATHSSATTNSGVRSTDQRNSGKLYYEVTVNTLGSSDAIGILTAGGSYTNLVTNATNCAVVYTSAGASTGVYSNDAASGRSIGNVTTNYTVGIAVDFDNDTVWFRRIFWNGVGDGTQSPHIASGGVSISSFSGVSLTPVIGFGGTGTAAGDNMTLNAGLSAYKVGPPDGYRSWLVDPYVTGTIVTTTKANFLTASADVDADSSTWSDTYTQLDEFTLEETRLSEGYLRVTRIAEVQIWCGARNVLDYKSSGKYYFEWVIENAIGGASNTGGLLTTVGTYRNMVDGNSAATRTSRGGDIWSNGASQANLSTLGVGDVACFAVDLDARLGWIRRNAGSWNSSGSANPATGVGGFVIAAGSFAPAISLGSSTMGASSRFNFGASPYAQTPPAGFGNWDSTWTPFKLTKTLSSPQPAQAGLIDVRVCVGKPSGLYYIDPQVALGAAGGTSNVATSYKSARYQYEGSETTSASIYRSGGAVDRIGQEQSRKIVTTANAQWLRPFRAMPYAVWNTTTGTDVTVTVYGLWSDGTLPNNDDVWLEVEYLGSASTLGSIVTTSKASLLASNAAVASDGSAWNGTATTFDGINALVTLSNGNLTVIHNSVLNNGGAISTAFRSYGKYYFEVTLGYWSNTSNFAGLMSSAFSGLFSIGMMSANSTSIQMGNGIIYSNGGNTGLELGNAVVGDVLCFAIDLTARLAWMRRNNGNWNASGSADPATGVGGVTIAPTLAFAPIVRFATASSPGDTMTANFGASAYAFTAPSGFLDWDTGMTPFKLEAEIEPGQEGYIEARVRVGKASATCYLDPRVNAGGVEVWSGALTGAFVDDGDSVFAATIPLSPSLVVGDDSIYASAFDEIPVGEYGTFDVTERAALSNGRCTATRTVSGSPSGAYSATSQFEGIYYFEVTLGQTTGATDCVGIMQVGRTLTEFGASTHSVNCQVASGGIYKSGSLQATIPAAAAGDIICIAYNFDSDEVWFRKNNGDWNGNALWGPQTGDGWITPLDGGPHTVAVCFQGTGTAIGDNMTVNFGQEPFEYAVPSGYDDAWLIGGLPKTPTIFEMSIATGVTFSNGNLTVTHNSTANNAGAQARVDEGGKFYFEITVDQTSGAKDSLGFRLFTNTFADLANNGANGSAAFHLATGDYYVNGVQQSGISIGPISDGDIISVAFYTSTLSVWLRKNGGLWNGELAEDDAPVRGIGALSAGVVSGNYRTFAVGFSGSGGVAGDSITANFGQSDFVYTKPSGFGIYPLA